ncbi:ribokinase [Geotalea uraniireducens]|uniref:Ribokinase n=1 Tax=Geotalea uraniireducens TaxID=351604 RepID=A0ABM8EHC4_9BACT|nr:PfkB family carbohydrate kinase [Geotalea uraniireducens]BDV41823.1 ribokinase [Geotalea uraniireducens]
MTDGWGGGVPVVTGIGQCCWDTLAVVDAYPAADSKVEAAAWEEQGGGPAATALVTLARFGIACRFAGVVGDDEAGTLIRRGLRAEGVDVAALATRAGSVSQRALIVVERGSGRRTIVWQRPTGRPLSAAEVTPELLAGSRLLHLDGLMAEASLQAARLARCAGIPVMVDAGRLRPGMVELAGCCDYLVAAEQFFRDLGWDGDEARFRRLAAGLGAPVVTVTLGPRGSLTWRADDFFPTPAFPVAVVDSTGAGDVFHGAYLYGVLRGWPLRRTVTFAAAAAALKCRFLGAQRGIPPLAGVEELLRERGIATAG